jgi:hypothetical protein
VAASRGGGQSRYWIFVALLPTRTVVRKPRRLHCLLPWWYNLFFFMTCQFDISMSVARPAIPWSMGKMFSQLSTVHRGTSRYLVTRRLLSASVDWRSTWPRPFPAGVVISTTVPVPKSFPASGANYSSQLAFQSCAFGHCGPIFHLGSPLSTSAEGYNYTT